MSRAVLISIRPQWCEKIASGEKTIEVRKTRPRWRRRSRSTSTAQRRKNGSLPSSKTEMRTTAKSTTESLFLSRLIKVLIAMRLAILARSLANLCAMRSSGYGWHISNLKVYDAPKKLSEFTAACKYKNDDGTCPPRRIACSFQRYDYNPDGSINIVECGNTIRRPPQSWGYVEGDV